LEDHQRIESEEFIFGIGIAISEVLIEYYKKNTDTDDKSVITLSLLKEDEKAEFDGCLEELRVMCKNEGFALIATKYFIPLERDKEDQTYRTWTNDEFILIKDVDSILMPFRLWPITVANFLLIAPWPPSG